MLVVKTLHIWMVISWFAGLFYLPRIFVNLAMVPADSVAERDRLLLMAGKLYKFMTPLGVLAVALGVLIWVLGPISGAHFNPAVTLALTASRKFRGADAAVYILMQLAGATLDVPLRTPALFKVIPVGNVPAEIVNA